MMRIALLGTFSILVAACGGEETAPTAVLANPAPVLAAVEDGTPQHPYLVAAFPFVQDNNTASSMTSLIDAYHCAPATGETGPEFYYKVVLNQPGTLKTEVLDGAGVDVDVHVLSSLAMEGSTATQCLGRADTLATLTNLAAGTYFVVVDSHSKNGTVYAGAYRLAVELDVPDQWQTVTVSPGVTWKKKIYSNYFGGKQTVNVLEVKLSQPGLKVKPHWTGSCLKTSQSGESQGAAVALNGSFFGPSCTSLCMVRINGALKSTNHLGVGAQRTFGVSAGGAATIQSVAAKSDWPEMAQALGGHPNLVTDGEVKVQPSSNSTFYTAKHPRTALGLTSSNLLLLVTVDGRTSAGQGMTMNELAQFLFSLGAKQAINLDGGGSTTMWVKGKSINGIVNHPSDNEKPDHWGERSVSDVLLVVP